MRIFVLAAVLGLTTPALAAPPATPPPSPAQPRASFARPGPRLGVQITELTRGLRSWVGAPQDAGVLVGDVRPDSAGGRAGLRIGDVIVAIGGRPVATAEDIRAALAANNEGDSVELEIVRDRRPAILAVIVPRPEPGTVTAPTPSPSPMFEPPPWGPMERRLEDLERRVQRLEKGK